jgi:penicillin amidase
MAFGRAFRCRLDIARLAAGGPEVAAAGPHAITILPPGEGNTITLDRFLLNQKSGDCKDLGPNFCDQLDMYKNWRFKDGTLAPDADHVAGAVSELHPVPGVRIVRDKWGIPHIFATGASEQEIEDNIGFGVGYAQAEERLFQMEILRRAAKGTLSDLVGPNASGTDILTMDTVIRRDSETDAERVAQIQALLTPGQQHSLQRFADGINAVILRFTENPGQMPAGFIFTQDLPIASWTPSDSLAIQILETKQVAESAGNELGYGALAVKLKSIYGVDQAVHILNDIQLTHDPLTPTSVPHGQAALRSSDSLSYDFISYSPADTATRINELPPSVEAARQAVASGSAAVQMASRAFGIPHAGSNAWAVAPAKSASGGAMLWGAPQVSYYVPQVLDEMEISGGITHVRGMSVPGGGPAVVIGYTPTHAWSLTSTQDDQVDTYIDRIRKSGDGKSFEYFWRGAWHPVQQRTETIRSRVPVPPQDPLPPPPVYTSKQVTFYRTLHGPLGAELPCTVSYIDTNGGVAYCKAHSFWGIELTTGLAVVDMGRANSIDAAGAAARQSASGFNFLYAGRDGHIGYWHTGRTPIRARGHDTRLPAPGDGSFDWQGYLDPHLWPSVVDPAQGYVVSWNNKPQRSWPDSGDGTVWGPVQRMAQPNALLRGAGKLDFDALWGVARRSGELDLRDTLGFRPFLVGLAARGDLSSLEHAALAQVQTWDGTAFFPDGAERDSSGAETGKVRSPGFPIMTAWFHALEKRLGRSVFQPVTGNADTQAGVTSYTVTAGTTSPEFEFFDDYPHFMYNVMAGRTHAPVDYLGGVTALDVSKAALDDAVQQLSSAQGPDPSKWRANMPQISFAPVDISSIPTIPWENRGTWGQAVDFGTQPGQGLNQLPGTSP